jgi:CheY-like chemotaxis protein
VKYTPAGTIEVRLGGDANRITLEVADTGIGIPEWRRHHLFEEYERFGADKTGIEGTGLGLAIAQRLARRLGGHLGHRDNPGGGSIFGLELPAAASVAPDIAASPVQTAPDRPLNVLVVDDSDVNRAVATGFLRQAGHTATEANDGIEAVRLAAANDFDVALMDMRMAGLDGLETARRIRALSGPRGRVPIVAVTANALDRHAEEARRAGMSDFLAKPFTQAELLAIVARAASRSSDAVVELTECVGEQVVQGLLDCLALRIQALLREFDAPMPFAASEALAELAHELVGGAGALGFTRLSEIAARFQTAIPANPAEAGRVAAELRQEAEAVLTQLRERRGLETSAGI